MMWRRVLCALLVLAGCAAVPGTAIALSSSAVSLGFGESYAAPDGSSCIHRGIDVALGSGARVEAPLDGTVRFAGRVPGPHGGSVLAVTIETERGAVSLLPLSELSAGRGDELERGEAVGLLADSGDPSSAGSHLHVGLRRGDLYVDPSVLLEAAAPAPAPVSPAPGPASPPPAEPVQRGAEGVELPGTAGAETHAAAGAAASAQAPEPVSEAGAGVTAPSAATGELAQGVTLSPAPGTAVRVAAGALPVSGSPLLAATADVSPSTRLLSLAETALGRLAGWVRAAGPLGFAGIAAAFAASMLLLGRRALEARIASNPPVSDRLGKLLQQLRAGDTLRGLTSCPGPLPSQSRGRLAQRR